jgi:hypothetical protein
MSPKPEVRPLKRSMGSGPPEDGGWVGPPPGGEDRGAPPAASILLWLIGMLGTL